MINAQAGAGYVAPREELPVAIKSLNAQNSADVVMERVGPGAKDSSAAFLHSLVRHLHAVVCETRPTRDQWRSAMQLLTDIGHATDDRRQEWVLASDLLGVTALVEEINAQRHKGATPNTVRGPFYRPDPPVIANGGSISLDGVGQALLVRGRVVDLDGVAIPDALVETWQANADGYYENQQPDRQPEFNLRGVLKTDGTGGFMYRTVRPAGYATPADGPVGQMLAGLGVSLRRPAHLHFIISANGFETISTHVFDGSDPELGRDALFGVKPELIGNIRRDGDGWALDFTFVMARARQERRVA